MNDHAKETDRLLTLSEAAKVLGLEEDRLDLDAQAGYLPIVWQDGRLVTKQGWLRDYIRRGREEHSAGDKQIRERTHLAWLGGTGE
jgi:hypothetical protein